MAEKVVIPWELKYDFAMRAYMGIFKGFLYAIREEYGAAATLKIYERLCKMGDRIKNLTKTLLTIFKIEGNDMETIAKWFEIWGELMGQERTQLELSKTFGRVKLTKCLAKTEYKDISDHALILVDIIQKTINPKATIERVKGMCAGDPYCEYVSKIED